MDFWTSLKIWVRRSRIWHFLIVYLIIVLAVKIIGGTFYRQLTVFQALGIAIIFLFLAYVYLNFIRKPKIIEKGFTQIILLGAIATIVALVAIGFFLYQRGLLGKFITNPKAHPTPAPTKQTTPTQIDKTANWETYVNQKYNFSIKYPTDFYFNEYKEIGDGVTQPIGLLSFFDSKNPDNQAHWPQIDIAYYKNPSKLLLEDWLRNKSTEKDNAQNPDPQDKDKFFWGVKDIKKMVINGIPAIRFPSSNGASTYEVNIIITKADKIYLIQSVNTSLGNLTDTLDLMASTFKFLD